MPQYRCDFRVASDVVLPAHDPSAHYTVASGHKITVRNANDTSKELRPGLIVSVVGQCAGIVEVANEFREALARFLDILTVVTNARFRIEAPIRSMEWEDGQVERQARIFNVYSHFEQPDVFPLGAFANSVKLLDDPSLPRKIGKALMHYRMGLIPDQQEDQFRHFWLALEIVSEHTKGEQAEPLKCSSCEAALHCTSCGREQTRRATANAEVRRKLEEIIKGDTDAMVNAIFKARNGLIHGRSVSSIEHDTNVDFASIVACLGEATWRSIIFAMGHRDDPKLLLELDRDFENMSFQPAAIIGFKHLGEGPHPSDEAIPSATISLSVSLRPRDGHG